MTMKKLMIAVAALSVAAAAYGQGNFVFNTRDLANTGNNIQFTLNGAAGATGADLFVEVLAGSSVATLAPLTPSLPLNRTGAGAGYTNPFQNNYAVATAATVFGYRAYQGTSWDTATAKSAVITTTLGGAAQTPLSVTLAVAPTPPSTMLLGAGTVDIVGGGGPVTPEPTTLALGALGVGALLLIRRRQ